MKNNLLSRNIRKYYRSAKMYGMISSCCANIDKVNKFVVHYRVVKTYLHMAKMKARFFLDFFYHFDVDSKSHLIGCIFVVAFLGTTFFRPFCYKQVNS